MNEGLVVDYCAGRVPSKSSEGTVVDQGTGRVPRKSSDVHVHAGKYTDPIPMSIAGPSHKLWNDREIRIFLLEWEGVEEGGSEPPRQDAEEGQVY